MANSLAPNASNPIAGLGTFVGTVADAGNYKVEFKTTIPLNSGLVVLLKQNASTMYTSPDLPTPTQQSMGGEVELACAAGDTVSIVLSSSAAADQLPNAVKSVVNVYQGL